MKFALISHVLPPSGSAHAMIIYRLLRDLDPDSYCLISSRDYEADDQPNYSGKLGGKYYRLRTFQLTRGWRFGVRSAREWLNLLGGTILRGIAIARVVRREQCGAIVVCTGGSDVLDMPAGYLASVLTGVRFYPYLLDQYIHMVSFLRGKPIMNRFEPRLLKKAAAVIAPNEFLRDEIRRRYQVEAVIIHNPCDLSEYEQVRRNTEISPEAGRGKNEIEIVYTGNLSILHYSPLRTLLEAIRLLDRKDIKLHLYTAQSREDAAREGLRGPVVHHEHEPVSEMPTIQQVADVLFLPLAFNSPYPEIVRTAAPGKMGEYLAARRPILVHAPADSFIAWYFRHHECGLVVDEDDPEQLAQALALILKDGALREQLSARAGERARTDFDLDKVRAQFADLMDVKIMRRAPELARP